jgi:hypothetical protein
MSAHLDSDAREGLDLWRARVLHAQAESDEAQLAQLYGEREVNLGPGRASQVWLEVMSAWDANAITG